jgi:hypothetical protein
LQELRVRIERYYGRPSDRRPADQSFPVLAPAEMLFPYVRAGVIERYLFTGARIDGLCSIAFSNIAMGTGHTQVLGGRLATDGARNNMIEMKCLSDEDLWRVAIFTSPGCPRFNVRG